MRKIVKVYDEVLAILKDIPEARNSDKTLFIEFWRRQGLVVEMGGEFLLKLDAFHDDAVAVESLRRSRASIQADEKYKDLLPTDERVLKARMKRAEERGTHIFRETTQVIEEPKTNSENQFEMGIKVERKKNDFWD